jgi:hypothetical protein
MKRKLIVARTFAQADNYMREAGVPGNGFNYIRDVNCLRGIDRGTPIIVCEGASERPDWQDIVDECRIKGHPMRVTTHVSPSR